MSKKKRFGVSEALTRGLTETISVVENNQAKFRNAIIPLSRIQLDPDNPRKLDITIEDIKTGLNSTDPMYTSKLQEYESITELAHTIENSGIINPIVVYRHFDNYRVVAGERRTLACILLEKNEIEARVYNDKPKGFELKLLQWVENTAREDLKLYERLENVQTMIEAYEQEHPDDKVTATKLSEITGLSLPQSSYYIAIINSSTKILDLIKAGYINNLDKAVFITKEKDNTIQQQLIDATISQKSLKELKNLQTQLHKVSPKIQPQVKTKTRGRTASRVNLGSTKKISVAKRIVDEVISKSKYVNYQKHFASIDWSDYKAASKAFRELIELLETEV